MPASATAALPGPQPVLLVLGRVAASTTAAAAAVTACQGRAAACVMPVDINNLTDGWLELESDPGEHNTLLLCSTISAANYRTTTSPPFTTPAPLTPNTSLETCGKLFLGGRQNH